VEMPSIPDNVIKSLFISVGVPEKCLVAIEKELSYKNLRDMTDVLLHLISQKKKASVVSCSDVAGLPIFFSFFPDIQLLTLQRQFRILKWRLPPNIAKTT